MLNRQVVVSNVGAYIAHAGGCVEHAISISLLLQTMIETVN